MASSSVFSASGQAEMLGMAPAHNLSNLILAKEQVMCPVRSAQSKFLPSLFSGASAVAAFLCLSVFAPPAQAQYQRIDLVSNQAEAAPLQDQHLVNGWGLVK
jgi:hypothetical protein